MDNIADNIQKVMHRIALSVKNSKNSNKNPLLLAVSKGQSSDKLIQGYQAGLRDFGENYLQEALEKINTLKDFTDISWHFIGPIQSNKTAAIAENFQWVHSVDRIKIADRLSKQRPPGLPPLNICLQVNIDNDPNKSGISPEAVKELALFTAALPHLNLRGLMTVPQQKPRQDPAEPFLALANLLTQLKASHQILQNMDTLSMGMSADFDMAIAAGATIVRVGSDIFGSRQ